MISKDLIDLGWILSYNHVIDPFFLTREKFNI